MVSMKRTTIDRHCRNCDYSRNGGSDMITGLSCVKGNKTYTMTEVTSGKHLDNKALSCDSYNPSQIVELERSRGFEVETDNEQPQPPHAYTA